MASQEVHSVYQVFTPTSQARLNFVPRDTITNHLVDGLRTPGKQLIVYGESGSGKSTLLLKLLEQTYPGHITTQCSVSTTFEQIVLNAFDQLDAYYIDGKTTNSSRSIKPALVADFSRIRASLEAHLTRTSTLNEQRLLPPQLTPQRLGQFLGEQGLCWVIEDFHKMTEQEKLPLAQSLKVFSDLASSYPEAKIIVVGATETARQVVQYDQEMMNRVAEIQVPLMTEGELRQIMTNGQRLLNVDFDGLIEPVTKYSIGVASVCHQLSLNACLEKDVVATSRRCIQFAGSDLESAVERYVRDSSDTLKAAFDKALKRHKVRRYDNCRLILTSLARGALTGMLHSEILSDIRKIEKSYPAGNLTTYLFQLTGEERGSLLRIGGDGRYRFVEPLHHTFAQVTLARQALPDSDNVIESYANEILRRMKFTFADSYEGGIEIVLDPKSVSRTLPS